MQSGLHKFSPAHIKTLWSIRKQEREDLRSRDIKLHYTVTPKQCINDLPPWPKQNFGTMTSLIRQLTLWSSNMTQNNTIWTNMARAPQEKKTRRQHQHTLPFPHQLSRMDRKTDTMTTALPTTRHHMQGCLLYTSPSPRD